ncbi:MAG: Superfamily helicase, family [Acidobacteria bacterium]|nr:Superfamily helicase, family [Acidobacteriota bacterium]
MVRGDDYFVRGRVRQISRSGNTISASVQGSRSYSVVLIVSEGLLLVSCSCPKYTQELDDCKHTWAATRAAAEKGLLPEESLSVVANEDDLEAIGYQRGLYVPPGHAPRVTATRRPAPRPASWETFLTALGPARIQQPPARSTRSVPQEIAYAVLTSPRSTMLTIQIFGRARKKSGEWSSWKLLSSNVDDLRLLPADDRDTIALLQQRSYIHRLESTITIPALTSAWWIERLARSGKLFTKRGEGELQPIAWDDGPRWTFRAAVVSEPARSVYRIEAAIERENETLPIASVTSIIEGIVIAGDRAGRFDDGGKASWIHTLRANGDIEVPFADAERFRQKLLRAPIGDLALPEELGWITNDIRPRPLLVLTHDAWGSELHGQLFFVYGDWRVAHRSAEMQKVDGKNLIRRDRPLELRLVKRLGALHVITGWDSYRIRLAQLEETARTLIAEGWSIEMDALPLRVTDDLDVEISSGIDWFDLNISASFGENRIALPELLAAAEANRTLLRLADGSFGVVPAAWTESLAPVLDLGHKDGDAVRFRTSQALLVDALLQQKPAADAAFNDLRQRLATASPAPQQEPPTLTAELRPYQRAGLGWLQFLRTAGVGGCLADDMGLGKTVQALALLESVRAAGGDRPSLVVAPRSLLFNWAAEVKKFAPRLRVLEHHGTDRNRTVDAFAGYDIILTTYATMRLDVTQLAEVDFEYVILDEAQAIKNASSLVAKASRLLRGRHRLALSGTPIENHLGELWSLFEFLNPGLLGSSRSFSRTFASKTAPPERRNALARALRPLILRRTKEQVAPELPERIEQTLYCELEGKQRRDYDDLREHYRAALLGRIKKSGLDKSRMAVLEALLRLRQAACHPGLIDPRADASSAKTDLLLEELSEVLDGGHRALVFSQFTSFLAIVRRELEARKIPYLYLDGKTRDRQAVVEEFQGENGPPLFLISLKAGGLGLNLTNADYIFLLDPWWNPAVEAQAIDRAHRIGRVRPVVAYRIIARDTVEEKILELQSRKRELAESIISEDNSVLRKLELEDIELLLS